MEIDGKNVNSKFSILSTSLRTFEQSYNPTVHCVYPLLLSMSNLFKKDDDPLVEVMSAKLDQLLDVYFLGSVRTLKLCLKNHLYW